MTLFIDKLLHLERWDQSIRITEPIELKRLTQFLPENGLTFSRNEPFMAITWVLSPLFRYFEFEVLTAGPMRVGWAKVDFKPGSQLGQDDCSWAFDGWRVYTIILFHPNRLL